MDNSLGNKLAALRRQHGFTQEEVANRLDVSPQAVSKWENDQSYPDILLLPKISALYQVAIDELLSNEPKKEVRLLPAEQRKKPEDMMLRIYVDSADGDRVRVNLPLSLVKAALELGIAMPQVSGNKALADLDLEKVLKLVDMGLIGNLVEVDSADGDHVTIVVE